MRNGAGSLSRRAFFRAFGAGAGSTLALPLVAASAAPLQGPSSPKLPSVRRVAANPTAIPAPIHRSNSVHHHLTLTAREVLAEIETDVRYWYMTFDGQVPGPMLRIRVGDTVDLTFRNPRENLMPHTVDFHAVYGPGGGMAALMSSPGQEKTLFFKAMYPGSFIYHCAVPDLDLHISNGMYGMIVVEPEEGLPRVNREFYLGQNEMYVSATPGPQHYHAVDLEAMMGENPTYVLLNGQKGAMTPDGFGSLKANVGETVRVFFVNGGPNLTSSLHAIGNIWTRVWTNGSFRTATDAYMQTVAVPPGDTLVADLALPVPGAIKLVDHALTRAIRKGAVAVLDVAGPSQPHIFNPISPGA
jgi:nitrite reductase (NO-forming)